MPVKIVNKIPAGTSSVVHGVHKAVVMQRIADGCGSSHASFLTSPSGMSPTNPFKSKKQQAYLAINKPSVAKKFAMHSRMK